MVEPLDPSGEWAPPPASPAIATAAEDDDHHAAMTRAVNARTLKLAALGIVQEIVRTPALVGHPFTTKESLRVWMPLAQVACDLVGQRIGELNPELGVEIRRAASGLKPEILVEAYSR